MVLLGELSIKFLPTASVEQNLFQAATLSTRLNIENAGRVFLSNPRFAEGVYMVLWRWAFRVPWYCWDIGSLGVLRYRFDDSPWPTLLFFLWWQSKPSWVTVR